MPLAFLDFGLRWIESPMRLEGTRRLHARVVAHSLEGSVLEASGSPDRLGAAGVAAQAGQRRTRLVRRPVGSLGWDDAICPSAGSAPSVSIRSWIQVAGPRARIETLDDVHDPFERVLQSKSRYAGGQGIGAAALTAWPGEARALRMSERKASAVWECNRGLRTVARSMISEII